MRGKENKQNLQYWNLPQHCHLISRLLISEVEEDDLFIGSRASLSDLFAILPISEVELI